MMEGLKNVGFQFHTIYLQTKHYKGKKIDLFLEHIYKEIDAGRIILMTIGHGNRRNNSFFNYLEGLFCQHWISIWGYDKDGFIIYDSSSPLRNHTKELGNSRISHKILFQSYKFSLKKIILSLYHAKTAVSYDSNNTIESEQYITT